MPSLAHFVRRLSDLLAVAAALLLMLSVLTVCYMIVRRTLGYSSYWEIEVSIYLMVAATFLASPYTLRTGGHIAVDLVPALLPAGARKTFSVFLKVVGLLVCLYLAWEGLRLTHEAFAADERSISMWRPPRWPMYAMMPLGMSLTALQYLSEIILPDDAARASTTHGPAVGA